MRHAELYRRLLEIPEDRYLLHGSPHSMQIVEPRKAEFKENQSYDQLGIYATNCIDIAFLFALIHNDRREWGYLAKMERPFLDVRVPLEFVPAAGFVYVLPREGFEEVAPFIFIHRKPVQAIEVFVVDAEVLDEMIDEQTIEVWLCDVAPI